MNFRYILTATEDKNSAKTGKYVEWLTRVAIDKLQILYFS